VHGVAQFGSLGASTQNFMKVLKSIGLILWIFIGIAFMRKSDGYCFSMKGGVGGYVSQGQNIFAGILIILSGIVGLYTILNKNTR
jgi:hypothetical protein